MIVGTGALAPVVAMVAMALPQAGVVVPTRIDPPAVERIYNQAILKDGSPDRVTADLARQCADAARAQAARVRACLLQSHLEWRHGRAAQAMAAVDAGLAVAPTDDLTYHKARLLDAAGRAVDAREWYGRAIERTTSPALRESIRLRLTFLDAVGQNVESLTALAKTRPREFRNRTAIALAILDFDKQAAALYEVYGDGAERFRQHVRVAQWAIQAKEAARAQAEAWSAVRTATVERDRNYGLSLLVEAHLLDRSLDRLLDRLASQPTLTPEEQRVRVDLLRQTGRFADAIALFSSAHGRDLNPELRRELLRMYRDAGRTQEMLDEYTRLMTAEPASVEWPEGLGQYYLELGDQASARKVWEAFLGRNTDVGVLLAGADALSAFGLHDLAMTATDRAGAAATSDEVKAQVRLTQFELYRARGLVNEAEQVLVQLEGALPATAPLRIDLADAWERLQRLDRAASTLETFGKARGGLGIDEQMRLAWMLDSTGRRDDALAIWKGLWSGENLAARRKLVEERLLMLAAELGSLGELAVELEGKLAAGRAEPREVSLLVSLYTKVGDSVSAIDVVTAAAAQPGATRKSAIDSLKEQAQIYLALADYGEFRRLTERLIDLDPENKTDYLQSLLINHIEAGAAGMSREEDPAAQLRVWLAELRKVGGDAAGAEFEAGVLDMAGQRDQAIESYRRALALHPDRADDHLLLADLLRQAGRQAEAITSLQYLTEVAESDELFLVAIDGITNMRTASPAIVKWAQRRALERLTERDDKIYLYEMLAELAEENKDAAGYIAALEASLAHADSRRSHVLRELMAATADITTYEASQRTAEPNRDLNVAFGRRLVALGEELPPDVYVELGRTFIAMNDAASARRAFELAVDRTGRADLVVTAAQLFERGGFDAEAAREYERALVGDAGNLDVLWRLARIRERTGARPLAQASYQRALTTIVERQPRQTSARSGAADAGTTHEYKRLYGVTLAGLLSTLPAADNARQALVDQWKAVVTQELDAARQIQPQRPLSGLPRLDVAARTLRAIAAATNVGGVADDADRALTAWVTDESGRAAVDADRRSWGLSALSAPATTEVAGAAAAGSSAVRTEADYIRDIGVALGAGDQDAALTHYRQWARYAAPTKPPVRSGAIELPDRSPGLPEVASHAFGRLDDNHFTSLAQHIQTLVTDSDDAAEKIILDLVYQYEVPAVPILTRLETALGEPLIEESRLMRIVMRRTDWSLLNMAYVLGRLSGDRRIEVIERYGRAAELNWATYLKGLGIMLRQPLDERQRARTIEVVTGAFQNLMKRGSGPSLLPNFMNYAFVDKLHPANVPVVEAVEQFLAERHPSIFKVGYFRAHMLKDLGRSAEAVDAYIDAALAMWVPMPPPNVSIQPGQPSPYAFQTFVRNFSLWALRDQRQLVMDRLRTRETAGLTDALLDLRVYLQAGDPLANTNAYLDELRGLADRHPTHEGVRVLLATQYDQRGDTRRAVAVAEQLVTLKPDSREYRYRLAGLWQKLNQPEKALEATRGAPLTSMAPPVVRNYYIEAVTGPPTQRFPTLKKALEDYRKAAARSPVPTAGTGLGTLLQVLPPTFMTLNEYAQTRDAEDPYLYVRDFLLIDAEPMAAGAPPEAPRPATVAVITAGGAVALTPATPVQAPTTTFARQVEALQTVGPEAPTRTARLTAVVGRTGAGVDELDAYLTGLRAVDVDRSSVFLTMLIDATVSAGKSDDVLRLATTPDAFATMSSKDAVVWLGVAAAQSRERAVPLYALADRAGRGRMSGPALEQLLTARLAAVAGQGDAALARYRDLATRLLAGTGATLQPNTLQADAYGRDNAVMTFTGLGLWDEGLQWLDAPRFAQLVDDMLTLARPSDSMPVRAAHSRFVNLLYVRMAQAGRRIPALEREALAIAPMSVWTRPELLQAIFARAHAGRTAEALDWLKPLLSRELEMRPTVDTTLTSQLFAARQYQVALGLAGDFQALGPFGMTGSGIDEFKPLFAASTTGWPEAADWVSAVTKAVSGWLAAGEVNRDAALQMLALTATRLGQLGRTEERAGVLTTLAEALASAPASLRTTSLVVALCEAHKVPVALPLVQQLAREARLDLSMLPAVLSRTRADQGITAALALGRDLAAFTSDDGLLGQMVVLARESGDAAAVTEWTDRRSRAAAARKALSSPAGPTGSQ